MGYLLPRAAVRCAAILFALGSQALSQTRHPVISKVEIMFSLVTHYNHLGDRINFYQSYGLPAGNANYAVPHLVYEPAVTLYNPYNEALTLTRSRIKIWDPPVGFTFKKNNTYLRPEFGSGSFLGLARFQIANESNPSARKTFTLHLRELSPGGQPGTSFVLQPGESRTFSTWVENNWTWGLEVAGGYTVRSFFDWNNSNDFTNRDGRTANPFGAEAIPSPFPYLGDPRAGFQTDALSNTSSRPLATRYDFEIARAWSGNWVAIKNTDTVGVEAKTVRTVLDVTAADFQVDLLRGQVQDPLSDRVKAFPMSLSGIHQNQPNAVISRTFLAGDLLQRPNEITPGGKTPFATFTMLAKSQALQRNRFYTTPAESPANLYELHFTETSEFAPLPVMPSDAATGGPEILAYSRSGNKLFIDFTGRANDQGISTWKVRGTSSLEAGFPDNLGSVTTMMSGLSGSGIYKAIIDITGRGERYFIRIEE